MANKYHYDVKNCHYFVGTEDANGNITYANATPVALKGLRSMDLAAQGETVKVRADGIDYIVVSSNDGYEGDLNFVKVDDAFKVDCLGEVVDEATGIQYEDADAKPAHFALVGEFKGDTENIRWIFYNCTAGRPNVAGDNKDNMKEPDEESVTVTAGPLPVTIGGDEVNIVRGGITKTAKAATYAAWFTQVCIPGTAIQ